MVPRENEGPDMGRGIARRHPCHLGSDDSAVGHPHALDLAHPAHGERPEVVVCHGARGIEGHDAPRRRVIVRVVDSRADHRSLTGRYFHHLLARRLHDVKHDALAPLSSRPVVAEHLHPRFHVPDGERGVVRERHGSV